MIDLGYDPLIPFQSVLFLLSVLKVTRGRHLGEPYPT